jgi:hypothetical protein
VAVYQSLTNSYINVSIRCWFLDGVGVDVALLLGWNVECAFLTRGPTIDIDTFPSFVTSTPILSKAAKHSTIASLIPHISFMRRLSISCNPSNPFIRYQYHYLRSRHTPLNASKRSTNSSVN